MSDPSVASHSNPSFTRFPPSRPVPPRRVVRLPFPREQPNRRNGKYGPRAEKLDWLRTSPNEPGLDPLISPGSFGSPPTGCSALTETGR
jgi:hypothetical protein